MMNTHPSIVVVIGPTASGKSDFAVEYARTHNGEILSADSRQVYKGLDIGTGKITEEEMRGIPHYMLDVYDLNEEVSVVRFEKEAREHIDDILSRGKTPIICGGTGYYVDALIYGSNLPEVPHDKNLRMSLESKTKEELYDLLLSKDKARAETIDRDNPVRLIRALEILHHTDHVPPRKEPSPLYRVELFIMTPSREVLRTRIKKRIEKRLDAGMLEEVATLLRKKEYSERELKRFGIEYYLIALHLRGELTLEEMKERLFYAIYHYAKRQETWNKRYKNAEGFSITKIPVE
jgi:tRNA dimethylallyltransferase